LIHGQKEGSDTVAKIAKTGFISPQKHPEAHSELRTGAVSFTKDPNLNALIPKFGGKDTKAYGNVNIPYGDYVYRRINMPASVYDTINVYGGQRPSAGLFTYNRAITGTPDDAVPISLPKSYHLESEDIFIEADKLKAMGFSRPAGRGGDKDALVKIQTAIDMRDSTPNKLNKISDTYSDILNTKKEKKLPTESQVYSLYKDIRDLFKNEIAKAESVSVTGGAGSRYVNTIRSLATGDNELNVVVNKKDYQLTTVLSTLESELNRLSKSKNNNVLTEKANNIKQLRESLDNISYQTDGIPDPEFSLATRFSKARNTSEEESLKNQILKLNTEKNKITQQIPREWDVDVIDELKAKKESLSETIDNLTKGIRSSERVSKDKIMKITDKLAKGGLASRRT